MEGDNTAVNCNRKKHGTPFKQLLAPPVHQLHCRVEALCSTRLPRELEVGIDTVQRAVAIVQLQGSLKDAQAAFASDKMREFPTTNRQRARPLIGVN
jgi:hypothetical protein